MRKNNLKANKNNKRGNRFLAAALTLTLAFGCALGTTGCGAADETDSSANNNPDAKTLKIGLSSTSSKNHFWDEEGNETGYEYEFIKALDDALPQYKFEIVTTEFASLFVSLDADVVDAVVGNLRRNDEREEGYIHTYKAYNYTPYIIMVEETNTTINGLEDLEGKKLGISQGSLQSAILTEYIEAHDANIELVYTKDYTNDLVAGRIDAFIAPEFSLDGYNESFEDIKFKTVGDAIESESGNSADSNAYIYLAKGNEQLRDEFSEAIDELRKSGELSELISKFYDVDYVSQIDTAKEDELKEALGK